MAVGPSRARALARAPPRNRHSRTREGWVAYDDDGDDGGGDGDRNIGLEIAAVIRIRYADK